MAGLKFELAVNSETLKKQRKAKLNMASRVLILLGGNGPERRVVRQIRRRSMVRGCLVSGQGGLFFCRPLRRREI